MLVSYERTHKTIQQISLIILLLFFFFGHKIGLYSTILCYSGPFGGYEKYKAFCLLQNPDCIGSSGVRMSDSTNPCLWIPMYDLRKRRQELDLIPRMSQIMAGGHKYWSIAPSRASTLNIAAMDAA